jgi:hypothetical protein
MSKPIMPFLNRKSAVDLQNVKFPRRELPGKLLAIGVALLLPERRSEILAIPTEVQPKFKIGDLVAEDWSNDDGDDDEVFTDFGQILGMSYFKEAQRNYFEANSWVYYVNWTHSTSDTDFVYPTYDQEPTRECDLRFVKELGGQK